ncbi:hypothetical protein J3998_01590 [Thiomicrorhabdus sp. 6S2-11]|uniref:Uncharacterized protein n=1 Tax=Thiomicrorhabdus marina TaxID=2818442 RepID=A0ABS3Q1Q0_9GAMM|nr:hypothetical protein [Thiomicrorhabdus marina]MBO1926255.1 hypothetical protein [Thiomicrorhabdus marina]
MKSIQCRGNRRCNAKQQRNQHGFMFLLVSLMLVIGAAAWFTNIGKQQASSMKVESEDRNLLQLQKIKQKMLAYSILTPEIYADQSPIPGLGYFPCPDKDGDGNVDEPCGYESAVNQTFVYGRVPREITGHFFSFIDADIDQDRFWYAVDARLVSSHGLYQFAGNQRFSNVNPDMENEVKDNSNHDVPPLLLDGKTEIVMVLFYAGNALSGQNRPSNQVDDYLEQPTEIIGQNIDFTSAGSSGTSFNDYVLSITRSEWEAAILSRASQDNNPPDAVPDLCVSLNDNAQHWFNECAYTNTATRPIYQCDETSFDNLTGQNWRSLICP